MNATMKRAQACIKTQAKKKAAEGTVIWPHPHEPELDAFLQGKPIPFRECAKCGEVKTLSAFQVQLRRGKEYVRYTCRDCRLYK